MSSSRAHQPLFVLKQHCSAVSTCALDGQGVFANFLLSGDVDGIVRLWDLELREALFSFHPVQTVRGSTKMVTEGSFSSSAGDGVLQVGFLSFTEAVADSAETTEVWFYTQCRNQQLYVWKIRLCDFDSGFGGEECGLETEKFVELLHTIDVPQHGFCPVPSVCSSPTKFLLAVPHDSNGIVSLWDLCLISRTPLSCEGLKVNCSRSFSAAGTLAKCGTIMCISFRDSTHIAVAFESGNVSLNSTCGLQLAIIRAFAETAVACVWSGAALLVTSAEGRLQCYTVVESTAETRDDAGSATVTNISLVLRWEVTLSKGLGCVALQRHLVVVGSWDHTLRLFDEGSGRVISILTFHNSTVNSVAMPPDKVAGCALFGYDVRRPRCCDGGTVSCSGKQSTNDQKDKDVYLFASAGGDYAVAVWRVDFKTLTALSRDTL